MPRTTPARLTTKPSSEPDNLAEALSINQAVDHGLHYSSDETPGIRRRRQGKNFVYLNSHGRRIRNEAVLNRVRALAIPPAYEDVWISPRANGHLQATGFDARGRKQYRYHPKWREVRDATKFSRMIEFGALLPTLRRRIRKDLQLPGLPMQKVLALVATLLQKTLIRVGNGAYVKQNNSYGLTTLRDRHVRFISHRHARLAFRGKGGKTHSVELSDKQLIAILHRCHDVPGQQLFQYMDNGRPRTVNSGMINNYLLSSMGTSSDGTGFTAKDFRTWTATVKAIQLLARTELPAGQTRINKVALDICRAVAADLGNTPAICRKAYINPWVFTAWLNHIKPRGKPPANGSRAQEQYALKLLRMQARFDKRSKH